MSLPFLMNLVVIRIQKVVVEDTVWDDVFREPIGNKALSQEIEVKGQVNLGSKKFYELARTLTGDVGRSNMYLVFRTSDLEKQGVEIVKGDRVVKIADQVVDFEVTEIRPESPLNGRFLLKYVELEHVKEKRASTG